MMKKITQQFKDGILTKEQYMKKISQLRDKKFNNDLKRTKGVKTSYENLIIEKPVDNTYLMSLIKDITVKNSIKGLITVLTDNCYNINHIGLKINIAKRLGELKDINIIKVKNNYVKKEYSIINFKNNNIKFFNKLYLLDGIVFMSYLEHDNILTYAFGENLKYEDIHNKTINKNIVLEHENIKENTYTFFDKELRVYENIIDLLNVLKHFDNQYNDLTVDMGDIEDNLFNYLHIINSNEGIYYKYDKLYNKFKYVENYFKSLDNFKSNDLNIKSSINDYFIEDYLENIGDIKSSPINLKIDKKRRTSKDSYNLL